MYEHFGKTDPLYRSGSSYLDLFLATLQKSLCNRLLIAGTETKTIFLCTGSGQTLLRSRGG